MDRVESGMADPVTKDEVLDVMAELVEPGVEISLAASEEADKLAPWVEQVVKACGAPGAWISDQSCVCDFFFGEDHAARTQEVSVTLGVPVKCGDYIHEVARRLRDATVH
jgi:hypothetical protein